MPLYDYSCEQCGAFREFRSINERDGLVPCPTCARAAVRVLTAPLLNLVASATRIAETRNDKSAHEPAVVGTRGAARSSARRSSGQTPPKRGPQRGAHRPWMLGH